MADENTNKPDSEESQEENSQEIFEDRNSLVDSIVEDNDEQRIKDEEDVGITQSEDDQDEEDAPDEKKTDEEPKDEEDQDSEEDDSQDEMVEIVVYGEKKMVPMSEIKAAGIKGMQMQSAADKNLEEAKELLKDAKSLKKPDPETEDESEEKSMTPKDIAHAIQYGTEDEAAEAIEQLNTMGTAKPGMTAEDVTKIAKKTVAETTNANEIGKKFDAPKDQGGFGDLMTDPNLKKMAIDNVNARLGKGEANSWETYEAAGKDVREWLSNYSTPAKKDSFEDKKEKKTNIDTVKAANAVKGNVKSKDKGQTPSEVIDEIGSSRPGR